MNTVFIFENAVVDVVVIVFSLSVNIDVSSRTHNYFLSTTRFCMHSRNWRTEKPTNAQHVNICLGTRNYIYAVCQCHIPSRTLDEKKQHTHIEIERTTESVSIFAPEYCLCMCGLNAGQNITQHTTNENILPIFECMRIRICYFHRLSSRTCVFLLLLLLMSCIFGGPKKSSTMTHQKCMKIIRRFGCIAASVLGSFSERCMRMQFEDQLSDVIVRIDCRRKNRNPTRCRAIMTTNIWCRYAQHLYCWID